MSCSSDRWKIRMIRWSLPVPERLRDLNSSRENDSVFSGFGSATHNAALILFEKFNLEPNKDVLFVPTGTGPERLAAMGTGRIDAIFFNPSEVPQALKAGLVEIIQSALKCREADWPLHEAILKLTAKSSNQPSRPPSKGSILSSPIKRRP